MRRREFIGLLGGLVVWPQVARAQQGSNERLIGVLSPISEDAALRNVEALRAGLRDLGYFEGRNIKLEIKYAGGSTDRLPQLASELVKLNPDVIVAGSPPAAIAAHNATHTIPIVMNSSPDPVALAAVRSSSIASGSIQSEWGLPTVLKSRTMREITLSVSSSS